MPHPNDYDHQLDTAIRQIKERLPTCLNCFHFTEGSELCDLAKARPPARVIAFGCKEFDYCPF